MRRTGEEPARNGIEPVVNRLLKLTRARETMEKYYLCDKPIKSKTMNDENLIPFNERTPSELREIASNAGKRSGEARREKKSIRDRIEMIMNEENPDGVTIADTIAATLLEQSRFGDLKAIRLLGDYLGEFKRKIEIESEDDGKPRIEEYEAIAILRAGHEKYWDYKRDHPGDKNSKFKWSPLYKEASNLLGAEKTGQIFMESLRVDERDIGDPGTMGDGIQDAQIIDYPDTLGASTEATGQASVTPSEQVTETPSEQVTETPSEQVTGTPSEQVSDTPAPTKPKFANHHPAFTKQAPTRQSKPNEPTAENFLRRIHGF